MRRNTVTDLLRAEVSRPRAADLSFVLGVMQAVEKRRLYARASRLVVGGLLVVLALAVTAPWIETIAASLTPAIPALVLTATGLCGLYLARKQFGFFQ